MPSINLSNLSKPQALTNKTSDSPLSFIEWQRINVGISFEDAQAQYRSYLNNFYSDNTKKKESLVNQLKQDYINLLKRLQIIFENDEEFERYKNIDLNSQTDLKLAIPAYAKKLKELSLFYIRKREEVKRKKLEYNLVGAEDGVIRLLKYKLLTEFTKNKNTNFVSENPLISKSPELSSIISDFDIEIEEFYNTTDQFYELEQLNPFECVFNNICTDIANIELSAKIDPINDIYNCEIDDSTVNEYLQKAYYKYLGVDVGYVSGGYYTEYFRPISVELNQGNNFFYWFSGSTVYDIPDGIYKDTDINSLEWNGATGSQNASSSDTIFVNVGNLVNKGAWLYQTDYIDIGVTMSATMVDGKIFKFPFSNYGTSAVGGNWSGPGIDDTIEKDKTFFPTEEDFSNSEKNISNIYWNEFSVLSTAQSKHIQNLQLNKKAFSHKNFKNADKLINFGQQTNRVSFQTPQLAWLFNFTQTEIPITQGENNIYFPLKKYNDINDLTFTYSDNQSIRLSSVDVAYSFSGAVAANTIEYADKIFKLNSYCGPNIECAWLKSVPLKSLNPPLAICSCDDIEQAFSTKWHYISGGTQPSTNFKCEPNNYIRFTWTGEDTDINFVESFGGFDHDSSCPYILENFNKKVTTEDFLQTKDGLIAERWKKCTCQAIQYSPFGHNNPNFLNYKLTPDFIVKDTDFPNNFNSKTWLGSDKKNYLNSSDSARFFINPIEGDVGWGKGIWKSQTNSTFTLEKGQSYIYHRGLSNNCQFESPFIIINEPHKSITMNNENCEKVSSIPVWMKAVQDLSGNWIDANVISDMQLEFGDFISYDHKLESIITQQKLLYNKNEIDSVSGDSIILNVNDENISYISKEYSIPSTNFIIKIPLISASPYWAYGSYENDAITFNKKIGSNGDTFKVVSDYLQITQPEPSNIIFNTYDVIEYKKGLCDTSCFVWEEPLTLTVYNPIKQWNTLLIDECVQSNILNKLNKKIYDCVNPQILCVTDCSNETICDCENFCYTNKIGITATNIKSDIVLNTEISGIPVYVNYYANNGFVETFNVHDITNGEKSLFTPLVTGDFIFSPEPWNNLLNQNGSNFVFEETMNSLVNEKDIGPYIPVHTLQNRYETHNSQFSISSNNMNLSYFRKDNYFDNPFNKSKNDSTYVTINDFSNIDGHISTDKIQTFYPYENSFNSRKIIFQNTPIIFTPWNKDTGKWNAENVYINFRNQINVHCENGWFTNQPILTGNIWNWNSDVFGNEYFVSINTNINELEKPNSYATLYIKLQNGDVFNANNILSSVIDKYKNI